ncbi:hypothetical protein ACFE04_007204 [Oxalis oulophora]
MKRIDLFCASPASTAVDHRATVRLGQKLTERQYFSTCSSELLPLTPRPYNSIRKNNITNMSSEYCLRRKSSANVDDLKKSLSSGDSSRYLLINTDRWISAADSSDRTVSSSSTPTIRKSTTTTIRNNNNNNNNNNNRVSSSNESPVFSISNSSNPTSNNNYSSPRKNSLALTSSSRSGNQSPAALPVFNSSSQNTQNQVVVLRVSIHCKGCEGKLRKHLAKMKGVSSFEIDLMTKKVTIIGDVTPLSVLESVSRVKSAQLWPCSSLSSPAIKTT